jgi:hypothetical protein
MIGRYVRPPGAGAYTAVKVHARSGVRFSDRSPSAKARTSS